MLALWTISVLTAVAFATPLYNQPSHISSGSSAAINPQSRNSTKPWRAIRKRQMDNSAGSNGLANIEYHDAIAKPLPTYTSIPPIPTKTYKNAFNVRMQECEILANHTRIDFCDKAYQTIQQAGQILSNVFDIQAPLTISVIIGCGAIPCQQRTPNNISFEDMHILGNAMNSRNIPLLDDDGAVRFYPQGLVRQYNFTSEDGYFLDSDIVLTVNSLSTDFQFPDDDILPSKIMKGIDFLGFTLHEVLHGMGFISSYHSDPASDDRLWLNPVRLKINETADYAIGFSEPVFDRFLYKVDGDSFGSISEATRNLTIAMSINSSGPIHVERRSSPETDEELLEYYHLATKAIPRESISKNFDNVAITARKLVFVPSTKGPIFLETSLNPFYKASSISHLDHDTYSETPNFLMVYTTEEGYLEYKIAKYNKLATSIEELHSLDWLRENVNLNLAVGPAIRQIMQTMGWVLRKEV